MWIMISNSLDIDFTQGYIHGQQCKNMKIVHLGVFCCGLTNVWHHKQFDYSSEI